MRVARKEKVGASLRALIDIYSQLEKLICLPVAYARVHLRWHAARRRHRAIVFPHRIMRGKEEVNTPLLANKLCVGCVHTEAVRGRVGVLNVKTSDVKSFQTVGSSLHLTTSQRCNENSRLQSKPAVAAISLQKKNCFFFLDTSVCHTLPTSSSPHSALPQKT